MLAGGEQERALWGMETACLHLSGVYITIQTSVIELSEDFAISIPALKIMGRKL